MAGFCDPFGREDVTEEDAELWEATAENAPDGLSEEQAKYCLELLKTDFDLIVKEERQASQENIGEENVVSWKRVVQGVSESCDVCDATLFNLHWACPRCGFVVCLQCYISRKVRKKLSCLKKDSKNVQKEFKRGPERFHLWSKKGFKKSPEKVQKGSKKGPKRGPKRVQKGSKKGPKIEIQ